MRKQAGARDLLEYMSFQLLIELPRRLFEFIRRRAAKQITREDVCFERVLQRLDDAALIFDKPSSCFPETKAANLVKRSGEHVFGVLSRIPAHGLHVLDDCEKLIVVNMSTLSSVF